MRDNDPKGEVVTGMCRECADDLARWARAFADQDEPLLATLLEGLQDHMLKRTKAVEESD